MDLWDIKMNHAKSMIDLMIIKEEYKMITQQEMNELREDAKTEAFESWNHEYYMQTDWEYFCSHTNYYDVVEALEEFKKQATRYGWDLDGVL